MKTKEAELVTSQVENLLLLGSTSCYLFIYYDSALTLSKLQGPLFNLGFFNVTLKSD